MATATQTDKFMGADPTWVAQRKAQGASDQQIIDYINRYSGGEMPNPSTPATPNYSPGSIPGVNPQGLNAGDVQTEDNTDPNAPLQIPQSGGNVGDYIANFGKNLVNSGEKAIGGFASLPGIAANAISHPETIMPTIQAAGKGMLDEYGDLITNNPIDINNPKSLISKAYTDPVGLGLDLTGAEGLLKGAVGKLALKGAESAAPEVAAGAEGVANAENLAKPIVDSAQVPDMSAKQFLNNFSIPAYLAKGSDVMGNAKELLANGAGRLGSLSDLADHADQAVSTVSGIVQKVVDSIGSKTIDTPKILTTANETLSHVGGIDDAKQIRELGNMRSIINGSPDVITAIRDLENQGYDYLKGMASPTDTKLGNAYIQTARNLSAELDKIAASQGAVDAIKTPTNIAALTQISPRLAQLVQNASSISDLRSAIAPYVNLSKWVDATNAAAHTPASNLAGRVASGVARGAATVAGGAVGGVGGAIVGNTLGELTGPLIEAGAAKVLPKINNAVAQTVMNAKSGSGSFLPSMGNGTVKAGMNAAGKLITPTNFKTQAANAVARTVGENQPTSGDQTALANNNPDQVASEAEAKNPFPQSKYLEYVAKDPFHAAYYAQLRDYYLGQQYKAGALARIDSVIGLVPHATQLGAIGNKLNALGQVVPGANADPVTTKIYQQLPIIQAAIGHALGARVNPSSLEAIQAAIPTGNEKPDVFAQKMKTLRALATSIMGNSDQFSTGQ